MSSLSPPPPSLMATPNPYNSLNLPPCCLPAASCEASTTHMVHLRAFQSGEQAGAVASPHPFISPVKKASNTSSALRPV